jgi:hypothetical protein
MDDFIRYILSQGIPYWLNGLKYAYDNRASMTDQRKANLLLSQGQKAMENQDLESLKAAVIQLVRLLPRETQNKADDFGNVWGVDVNR